MSNEPSEKNNQQPLDLLAKIPADLVANVTQFLGFHAGWLRLVNRKYAQHFAEAFWYKKLRELGPKPSELIALWREAKKILPTGNPPEDEKSPDPSIDIAIVSALTQEESTGSETKSAYRYHAHQVNTAKKEISQRLITLEAAKQSFAPLEADLIRHIQNYHLARIIDPETAVKVFNLTALPQEDQHFVLRFMNGEEAIAELGNQVLALMLAHYKNDDDDDDGRRLWPSEEESKYISKTLGLTPVSLNRDDVRLFSSIEEDRYISNTLGLRSVSLGRITMAAQEKPEDQTRLYKIARCALKRGAENQGSLCKYTSFPLDVVAYLATHTYKPSQPRQNNLVNILGHLALEQHDADLFNYTDPRFSQIALYQLMSGFTDSDFVHALRSTDVLNEGMRIGLAPGGQKSAFQTKIESLDHHHFCEIFYGIWDCLPGIIRALPEEAYEKIRTEFSSGDPKTRLGHILDTIIQALTPALLMEICSTLGPACMKISVPSNGALMLFRLKLSALLQTFSLTDFAKLAPYIMMDRSVLPTNFAKPNTLPELVKLLLEHTALDDPDAKFRATGIYLSYKHMAHPSPSHVNFHLSQQIKTHLSNMTRIELIRVFSCDVLSSFMDGKKNTDDWDRYAVHALKKHLLPDLREILSQHFPSCPSDKKYYDEFLRVIKEVRGYPEGIARDDHIEALEARARVEAAKQEGATPQTDFFRLRRGSVDAGPCPLAEADANARVESNPAAATRLPQTMPQPSPR